MSKNYRAALSACLGDPVDGNPTGVMQEAAFAACGLNWRYLTIRVKDGDLPQAFDGMKAMLEQVIWNKPAWHGDLDAVHLSQAGRTMNQIGG